MNIEFQTLGKFFIHHTNMLFLNKGLFLKPTIPNGVIIKLMPIDLNNIKIALWVNMEKCPFFGDIYHESRTV